MKINSKYFGEVDVTEDSLYTFPEGLPGFEDERRFAIICNEDKKSPFQWLQSVKTPDLAFVVIEPFSILPDYEVEVPDDEVSILEIHELADVSLLSIVVVPEDITKISANLLAPVILNTKNHHAKQVTMNTNKYRVRQYIINNLRSRGGND